VLVASARGIPEKRISLPSVSGERIGNAGAEAEGGTEMGTTVRAPVRLGKCEMSGVFGGGRIKPNSGAKERIGVCAGPSAIIRFTFCCRSVRRVCEERSSA